MRQVNIIFFIANKQFLAEDTNLIFKKLSQPHRFVPMEKKR